MQLYFWKQKKAKDQILLEYYGAMASENLENLHFLNIAANWHMLDSVVPRSCYALQYKKVHTKNAKNNFKINSGK